MARMPNATPPKVEVANGHDAAEGEIAIVEADVGADADGGQQRQDDPGIEALRKQLEEANARTANAERERDALRNARQNDAVEIADSRVLVIDSSISQKETEKKAILTRLKDAKEAGDYDAEIAATDELNQINIDLKQAKLGKSRLEDEIKEAKTTSRTGNDDPFEQYIADARMHPRAERWLRAHREYATDPVKNAELVLAHQKALAGGAALNTDAYFDALEGNLGMGEQQEETHTEQRQQEEAPVRRQATPSAPPSRAPGLGGGSRQIHPGITDLGNGQYRVTPAIKEAAAMSGLTLVEYIEEAKKLVRGDDGQLH